MTVKKQNPRGSYKRKSLHNKTQLYVQCSVVIRQEGSQYSSWCPELDIASCGSTIEEARENLNDAINCFLQTCSESGELAQVLKARGIKLLTAEEPPGPVFLSETRISIPLSDNKKDITFVSV
jgi:predicted RNase H-like HicB family nuclease